MTPIKRDASRDERLYDACLEALERIDAIALDEEDELVWQGSPADRAAARAIASETLVSAGLRARDDELEQMIALIVGDAKGHA
jgi:hypothetical protein